MRLTLEQAQARYGVIQGGVWLDETKWCVLYTIPKGISLINSTGGIQQHIYCNRDILQPLDAAFYQILQRGLSAKLHTFDGCLMLRDVRGEPGKPSTHSYACALDFDAETNKLGDVNGDMHPGIVECFKSQGFSWGGDFSRVDKMHYSLAWET